MYPVVLKMIFKKVQANEIQHYDIVEKNCKIYWTDHSLYDIEVLGLKLQHFNWFAITVLKN